MKLKIWSELEHLSLNISKMNTWSNIQEWCNIVWVSKPPRLIEEGEEREWKKKKKLTEMLGHWFLVIFGYPKKKKKKRTEEQERIKTI